MNRIVLTYNSLTLCRALRYTELVWGKDNTVILYMNLVNPIPQKIINDYNIINIETNHLDKKKGSL